METKKQDRIKAIKDFMDYLLEIQKTEETEILESIINPNATIAEYENDINKLVGINYFIKKINK